MKNKRPDQSTGNGKYMVSAPIIHKQLMKKNGQPTEYTELYLRRSTQDYFIKFCESAISREELAQQLNQQGTLLPTLTLEIEFREGSWDICDGNHLQQSRIGEYVVIHRIVVN